MSFGPALDVATKRPLLGRKGIPKGHPIPPHSAANSGIYAPPHLSLRVCRAEARAESPWPGVDLCANPAPGLGQFMEKLETDRTLAREMSFGPALDVATDGPLLGRKGLPKGRPIPPIPL